MSAAEEVIVVGGGPSGLAAAFAGAKLVAFRKGMVQYADLLAGQLDVTLNARVTSVQQHTDGATVTWTGADGEHTESVAGCVVALPAQLAAAVRVDLDAWRTEYLGVYRARTTQLGKTVHLCGENCLPPICRRPPPRVRQRPKLLRQR